jgi:hypothetical protein
VIQRTFKCSKDTQLVQASGPVNGGVGAGQVVGVGALPNGSKTRTEFEFEADWSQAVTVTGYLLLRVTNTCSAPGSAVKFYAERMTAKFTEGTVSDTCGVGPTNAEVWPGQASTTTHRAEWTGTPSNGDYIKLDVSTILQDVLAANTDKVWIRLIASDGAGGYDESNANRYCGFWSTERGNDGSGFRPRLEVVIDTTHPPNAPTEVTPATTGASGTAPTPSRVDTSFTVRGRFTDADAGQFMTASHVQFYPKGSTDDGSGNITAGAEITNIAGTGVFSGYTGTALLIAQPISVPPSRVGAEILGRVRVRDNTGRWGTWTRLSAMRVIPNSKPKAPTGLGVDTTASATPDFTGRHVDRDAGSTVAAVETQVVHETNAGIEMLMNRTSHQAGDPSTGNFITDPTSGGPQTVPKGGLLWRVSYDGTHPLQPSWRVKRRHRTVDQFGAVGDWCAWQSWVVGAVQVPTFIPAATNRQDDLTPLLGASYPETITGVWVEVYSANDLASTLLWASGERTASGSSKTIEYGSVSVVGTTVKDLAWGQLPWGRSRVRIASSGNPSRWTELQPILLNTLPLAPPLSIVGATTDSGGVYRVPSLLPRINCPFTDDDEPNDSATKRMVQLFRTANAYTPIYQGTVTATPIEDWADVPSNAALAWETQYFVKVRHADNSGHLGPWALLYFTTHRPPLVVAGTAPVVGDPTPTINWTATFYAGATQLGYQVIVDDITSGSRVFDTRFVADTTAVSYVVPAYLLTHAHQYQARVYVTDTLGVTSLLNGQASQNPSVATQSAAMIYVPAIVGSALPLDPFTRTTTDTWGTDTNGHSYDYTGPQADFDTTGTTGTIVQGAGAPMHKAIVNSVALYLVTMFVDVKTDKLAVGGTLFTGVLARVQDPRTHYSAELQYNTDQTIDLLIVRTLSSQRTILGKFRTALTHVAGTNITVKINVAAGASGGTALQAKAWTTGGGEPGYQVSATDNTAALLPAGSVGVRTQASVAITNAPVTFTFDNLATTSP